MKKKLKHWQIYFQQQTILLPATNTPLTNLVISKVKKFKRELSNTEGVLYTTMEEVASQIKTLKAYNSPGLDNRHLLIKNLPDKSLMLLVIIFNSCIFLNYFATQFKNAKDIAFPRPNKPGNDPKNYRPISLLSNFGKIFEKIIYKRIFDFSADNSLIANEQFGFRKDHSAGQKKKNNTNATKY